MSNPIIEKKMEELRKTSLKLAIWNLGLYNFARVMGELHE